MGFAAVPAFVVTNEPREGPAASLITWPGTEPASAACNWAAVETLTVSPAGGGVVVVVGVADVVVTGPPPSHGSPFTVQPEGSPEPATLKPKPAVAPGLTVPLKPAFVNL